MRESRRRNVSFPKLLTVAGLVLGPDAAGDIWPGIKEERQNGVDTGTTGATGTRADTRITGSTRLLEKQETMELLYHQNHFNRSGTPQE